MGLLLDIVIIALGVSEFTTWCGNHEKFHGRKGDRAKGGCQVIVSAYFLHQVRHAKLHKKLHETCENVMHQNDRILHFEASIQCGLKRTFYVHRWIS